MKILRATLILEATICPYGGVPITTLKGEMVDAIRDKAKRICNDDIKFKWTTIDES